MDSPPPPQALWGALNSAIPARIAYLLNLKGPAVAIDTACSSSLVAIHMSCQSLWSGETEMALAGGVYINNTPQYHLLADKAGMLATGGAALLLMTGPMEWYQVRQWERSYSSAR